MVSTAKRRLLLACWLLGSGVAVGAEPPPIPVPVQPRTPYGYYQTQWKPFPTAWVELRPIPVSLPTSTEPPLATKMPTEVRENGVPRGRERMILPDDMPKDVTPRDLPEPVHLEPGLPLNPSPYGPIQNRRGIAREVPGPAVPIPLPGSIDLLPTSVTVPANDATQNASNKAWLGLPKKSNGMGSVEVITPVPKNNGTQPGPIEDGPTVDLWHPATRK